jgi:protein involved in sex pheromone biosynthesis
MKQTVYTFILLALLSLSACGNNDNETNDKVETKDINRDGSIETVVTTENLSDSTVLLVTMHKVWRHNAVINSANDKKDYEFYITVK